MHKNTANARYAEIIAITRVCFFKVKVQNIWLFLVEKKRPYGMASHVPSLLVGVKGKIK